MNCWICGAADAATREHRIKASDLKRQFGAPTQNRPFYFNAVARPGMPAQRNYPVGSLKSNALKYTHRICQNCNSARTQSHDYAWAHAAAKLSAAMQLLQFRGDFRANWLFPYDTRGHMLYLHIYFVKLFGCQVVEGRMPIDIAPFSKAILEGRPHPNLFLAFGHLPNMPVMVAGGSDIQADLLNGQVAFASWLYQVGDLCVNVLYAVLGERRQGLNVAWHPYMGCQRLPFTTFGE